MPASGGRVLDRVWPAYRILLSLTAGGSFRCGWPAVSMITRGDPYLVAAPVRVVGGQTPGCFDAPEQQPHSGPNQVPRVLPLNADEPNVAVQRRVKKPVF